MATQETNNEEEALDLGSTTDINATETPNQVHNDRTETQPDEMQKRMSTLADNAILDEDTKAMEEEKGSMLLGLAEDITIQQSDGNIDYARADTNEFHIKGTFKTHWPEYVKQPYEAYTVMTHENKEEELHFANPRAPRRIYMALKIKRISDVDNVRETYRCRFHLYFDWLLTKDEYLSYVEYKVRITHIRIDFDEYLCNVYIEKTRR